MLKPFRIVRSRTNVPFVRMRIWSLAVIALMMVVTIVAVGVRGLNFGVDFRGGSVLEVRFQQAPDLAKLRSQLSGLGLGDISLQRFGESSDVLVRVPQQNGDEKAQLAAVNKVRDDLGAGVEYRRVEFVGPQVGLELIQRGIVAVILSIVGIMIYVWFRFEWQFGVSAFLTTVHDVVAIVGVFALFQIEFNLTTVAALLTIAGYSINDTVVVFDRIRESFRRYKSQPLPELLNRAINDTLSRTIMTSLTTFIAVLALFLVGGEVIRGFSLAMLVGIVVGTFSSICIATPMLLWLHADRGAMSETRDAAAGAAASG